MEKVLSFFRVFDLSFFAPGAILYGVLRTHGYMGELDPLATEAKRADVSGLVAIVSVIVLIYLLGVIVHPAREVLGCIPGIWEWASSTPADSGSSWYQGLEREAKNEISTYFWYMRATCFNLCITGLLVAIFFWVQQNAKLGFAALISAVLLYWLGTRYDRALHRVKCQAVAAAFTRITPG
jgi:hypothetical protein